MPGSGRAAAVGGASSHLKGGPETRAAAGAAAPADGQRGSDPAVLPVNNKGGWHQLDLVGKVRELPLPLCTATLLHVAALCALPEDCSLY